MTTKILTMRIPNPLYSTLCRDAGEMGVPVSTYIRRLIEREHEADQLSGLRNELLARLDILTKERAQPFPASDELLLLCRAVAAHLNPQMVAQVRAKLSHKP